MARAEVGVYIPQVSVTFEQLLARALLCEQLGYDSFWVYDHLYAPNLPGNDALEGWTLATALLARTTRLRVGHLVLDNNFRHPALLAKMATTLDVISGGRLDFGIGSGSYEPEHGEGGFPWGPLVERSARLEEALEIITRMFASERTTYDGQWYHVRDLPNLPQPVQQPRPPVHIGGIGERYTLPLVARFADVWNVPTYGLGVWRERGATLDAACDAIGRDPATVRRSLEAVLVVTDDDHALVDATARAERRYAGPGWGLAEGGFVGTPPAIVDRIGELMDEGMSLFVFFLADRGERDMLHLLAEEVIPHLPR
jgi:alkanesulfonate monooxygenase SsuD/methylene tetrahydromethanopterin reductase-like flavin-dependent oxidoreductase (luciferase family)